MNFQPPSRSLTPRDYQFIIIVGILFVAVCVGLVYANLSLPIGGGDFLAHWEGVRAFFLKSTDPYSGVVPSLVQELVYGPTGFSLGDKPYILDTPFHLLLLYFPFALLSDPQLARAIFTLILELSLFALALLSLRLTDWTAPCWFVLFYFLFCIFNFYSFKAILAASPVLMLGLIYAGIFSALREEQDELAGALMAASLYYWQVGGLFLALMAWYAYRQNRTRILAGFGMLSIVLFAVSFLTYANWIIPYLRAGINNLRADFWFSVFNAFARLQPAYGKYIAWGLVALLVLAIGYEWNAVRIGDLRRLYWVGCLMLAASPLIGFKTELSNLSVLVIPLALIFSVIYDRWNRIGAVLTFFFLLLIFFVPWGAYLFLPPQYNETVRQLQFIFLPLFTVLGLYWVRWWALRPPRVWADSVTRNA